MLLRHPDNFPASLREAVERRVADNECWNWRALDLDGESGNQDPVTLLARRFVVGADGPPSVAKLMASESCRDLVVWIDGLDRGRWREWMQFLVDYDRQARNATADHLLLCVDLAGERAAYEMPGLAGVASCLWKNVVERHDASLFIAGLLRGRREAGLLGNVRLALCTELAGTDGYLATQLVAADMETLVRPVSYLRDIARMRGVSGLATGKGTWHTGGWEYWDEVWRVNSCVAAVSEPTREVTRRVWKAEIGVVFPFIEERRLELVEILRPLLRLPLNTGYGVIEEAADLEIGQLRYGARINGVRGRVRRSVELLASMRHALAHLEPVSAEQLREAASLAVAQGGAR